MDSGLLPVDSPGAEVRLRSIGQFAWRASRQQVQAQARSGDYAPPESPAVVIAGSPAPVRRAVVGELLGAGNPVMDVPDESYLVLRHGMRPTAQAFLPGSKQPSPYPQKLPRPPRRVELTMPASLLTSFALVTAPAAGAFGPAYDRIVLDTAERGGGLLVTLDARVLPGQAELDFLVAAAQRATVPFFAVWADQADEATTAKMATYRDVVASRVPRFADAPWFLVVPGSGAADLRQALADWAGITAPRREETLHVRRRVPTAVDGRESGWEELLDRVVKAAQQGVRQRLGIELAKVHLRCVQEILFGDACEPDRKHSGDACEPDRKLRGDASEPDRKHRGDASEPDRKHRGDASEPDRKLRGDAGGPDRKPRMPAALDREMHALSLRAADEVDAAIIETTRQVLAHVLAEAPYDDVLRRVADALRERIDEDGPELDQLLLVTSTGGGVVAVSGAQAATGLAAYHTQTSPGGPASGARGTSVLPPLGIGLSASCYKLSFWSGSPDGRGDAKVGDAKPGDTRTGDAKADAEKARAWLQDAVRGTELELQRVLAERFDAVQQVLSGLIGDAVDHGLLLV